MHRRLDLLIRSVQRGVDHVHPDAIRSADQIFAWKTHNHSLKGIDVNSKNPSGFSTSICCLLSHNLNRRSHLPMIEYSSMTHFLQKMFQSILFPVPFKFSLWFPENDFPWFFPCHLREHLLCPFLYFQVLTYL